jgi:hypothetical protein
MPRIARERTNASHEGPNETTGSPSREALESADRYALVVISETWP